MYDRLVCDADLFGSFGGLFFIVRLWYIENGLACG